MKCPCTRETMFLSTSRTRTEGQTCVYDQQPLVGRSYTSAQKKKRSLIQRKTGLKDECKEAETEPSVGVLTGNRNPLTRCQSSHCKLFLREFFTKHSAVTHWLHKAWHWSKPFFFFFLKTKTTMILPRPPKFSELWLFVRSPCSHWQPRHADEY